MWELPRQWQIIVGHVATIFWLARRICWCWCCWGQNLCLMYHVFYHDEQRSSSRWLADKDHKRVKCPSIDLTGLSSRVNSVPWKFAPLIFGRLVHRWIPLLYKNVNILFPLQTVLEIADDDVAPNGGVCAFEDKSKKDKVKIEIEERKPILYKISDAPPLYLTLFFAIQVCVFCFLVYRIYRLLSLSCDICTSSE